MPIAKNKAGGAVAGTVGKKAKPKKTKEVKIVVGGFTVSVKARRLLSDELVIDALQQAIGKLGPEAGKRAA